MLTPPDQLYAENTPYEIWAYDLRIASSDKRYSRQRAAWGEYADVEMLNDDHPVLVVRPGAERRSK